LAGQVLTFLVGRKHHNNSKYLRCSEDSRIITVPLRLPLGFHSFKEGRRFLCLLLPTRLVVVPKSARRYSQ
jgi:hypothetical protein